MRHDLLSAVRIVTTDVPSRASRLSLPSATNATDRLNRQKWTAAETPASSNAAAILPEERTGPMRPTDADRTPMPLSSKESSDVDSWW